MIRTVARSNAGVGGSLGTDEALLYPRRRFGEDISRGGIAVDIPRFGTAMRAFGHFDVLGGGLVFFGGVDFIAILFTETGAVGIGLGLVDGTFVYLIGAWRSDDEEEGVDGTTSEVLAVEAEGVGGVLEEEGGRALGFGYGVGGRFFFGVGGVGEGGEEEREEERCCPHCGVV